VTVELGEQEMRVLMHRRDLEQAVTDGDRLIEPALREVRHRDAAIEIHGLGQAAEHVQHRGEPDADDQAAGLAAQLLLQLPEGLLRIHRR
jgi:hypothetical protein